MPTALTAINDAISRRQFGSKFRRSSWRYSLVGRGTTFRIFLPIDVGGTARLPGNAVSAVSAVSGLTALSPVSTGSTGVVLLVDDDALVRRTSWRRIERVGFTVVEASDGATALGVAARRGLVIDALLTDLMMPGISGREVIVHFRVLRPGVPIVCLTGFAAAKLPGSTSTIRSLFCRSARSPFLQ